MAHSPRKRKAKRIQVGENPAQKSIRPDESDGARKDRLDFGGLPARDLKKNLGCG
jgi:hypothetical protein